MALLGGSAPGAWCQLAGSLALSPPVTVCHDPFEQSGQGGRLSVEPVVSS
jgi:hypothetical protein